MDATLDGSIEERPSAAGSKITLSDGTLDVGGRLNLYGSSNGAAIRGSGKVIVHSGAELVLNVERGSQIFALSGGAVGERDALIVTVEKGGLLHTPYTMGTGRGAHLIADHSLEATLLQISMGSIIEEKSEILVDGKGGTTSTRFAVTMYPGNE